jgi:murein DD-endopeptidase MepM/ murein hydrolase activator NlpD
MKQTIRTRIAADIESTIKADPSFKLPRLVDLAQQYHVSYPTIWKAVSLLVEKGVIARSAGKKLTIKRMSGERDGSLNLEQQNSASLLFEKLKLRILDGTYLLGRPFPKAGYFLAAEGVSYLTISQAFARLSAENLAHKSGRTWIAGPRSLLGVPASPLRSALEAPAVVVITPNIESWDSIFNDGFTSRFMLPFATEISNRGGRLVPALLSKSINAGINISAGIDPIRATIQSLGERYLGALLVGVSYSEPELGAIASAILPFDKPLVFFESAGID